MSDSDTTAHKNQQIYRGSDYEDDADCCTQLLEPNNFVLLNLATKNGDSEVFYWADPRNRE
jgi:hypothetical protein